MPMISRLLLLSILVCLTACFAKPSGSQGFTLPDGDAESGKEVYLKFACHSCHDTKEVPQLDTGGEVEISVMLGGETTRIKTYGELVTSIINPSHRVPRRHAGELADEAGKSRMIVYNDVMTVAQLIDLVAFVQASYTISPYTNTAFPVYWYPDQAESRQ